jgi:hypothetical protein
MLSASQIRRVLSKEDVARRDMLRLHLTSVPRNECSSEDVHRKGLFDRVFL